MCKMFKNEDRQDDPAMWFVPSRSRCFESGEFGECIIRKSDVHHSHQYWWTIRMDHYIEKNEKCSDAIEKTSTTCSCTHTKEVPNIDRGIKENASIERMKNK
mmetsp:Transcript_8902/g.16797  ORF Transcript_8902/g.16797 Transcript_8902/m.16797 type:complete len:102 (+) Transcript_8902:1317-1622(+)